MSQQEKKLGYTSVKIPDPLTARIKKLSDQNGYRTITEFVIDAARRRIDELS
jgi:hypothetical protein